MPAGRGELEGLSSSDGRGGLCVVFWSSAGDEVGVVEGYEQA